MFLEPVCEQELAAQMHRLNNSKPPGPDGIGPKLIQIITSVIVSSLTPIYHVSVYFVPVPDVLKLTRIIPVYTKGNRTYLTNHRPTSFAIFHKLLEKLMSTRLNSFLNANGILYDFQFGFRPNRSTSFALIGVMDNIYYHQGTKDHVVGIYLDLQKALDTVSYEILLWKLNNYGIRGSVQSWLSSYLNNRNQFTFVNEVYSSLFY
jgi:Reverse transcriptase (RNA-dependent DNA polymerase)